MINSRQKGARAERQFRDKLREAGFEARRGQQYSGDPEAPDVKCKELDRLMHFEVKAVENLSIFKAIDQAIRDCGKGRWPIVTHTKNNKPWLITMQLEDWLDLIKEWHERSNI